MELVHVIYKSFIEFEPRFSMHHFLHVIHIYQYVCVSLKYTRARNMRILFNREKTQRSTFSIQLAYINFRFHLHTTATIDE